MGKSGTPSRASTLRLQLVGANPSPDMEAEDELPGKSHYFIGNDPKRWRTNVPHYAKVRYRDAYPGIDLVYYGNQRQLEHDFVVAPGADPEAIKLRFQGVDTIEMDDGGDLVLHATGGEVRLHKPIVYQDVEGDRQAVSSNYTIGPESQWVSFALAPYDESRTLIIDPVLSYSTYLGGAGYEVGWGIDVDAFGNAYVVGDVDSVDFPTANPFQTTPSGSSDAFIAKLNASGNALVYSTYLGGSGGDGASDIALDGSGNAYVTGSTGSSDFPTANPYQASLRGYGDAFIAKLNASGNALVYSTYLGGSGGDWAGGIAVDGAGNAYVAGSTSSSDFPTANPYQASLRGSGDAFIAKLNATGNALVYSTYLGSSGGEGADDIALSTFGDAYVTGTTHAADFPTVSPFQASFGGGWHDAFVAKLDPSGSAVYSTYLGGNSYDWGLGIAVDVSGSAYVTGYTFSPDFPTVAPFQATRVGRYADAFVAKFSTSGNVVYSTYLGGTDYDEGNGIAVDSSGNAYIAGFTMSVDFPVVNPVQATFVPDGGETFVTSLNASGNALIYSTYLGGSSDDLGFAVAVDSLGNAYVTGQTYSLDFPTVNPFQAAYGGGGSEAFVAKISAAVAPNQPPTADAGPDQQVLAGPPGFAVVTLDGSASTDPDSSPGTNDDIVLFEWFENFGTPGEVLLGAGATLNVSMTVGTHAITLRVTDTAGQTDTDAANVLVFNTQTGSNVKVTFPAQGVTVTFAQITQSGVTTVEIGPTGPDAGDLFLDLASPTYYDITTTAQFSGTIKIEINYDDTGLTTAQEAALKLYQFKIPPGAYVDITDPSPPPNPSTGANRITGTTTQLSFFVVAIPIIPASLRVEPEIVNLKARGVFSVFITLPQEFDVLNIDGSTVIANGTPAVQTQAARFQFVAHFARGVLSPFVSGGTASLRVDGSLSNGLPFRGRTTVKVRE